MLFIAKHISMQPPKISNNAVGNFLKKFPTQKPLIDIIKEAKQIINIEIIIGLSVNFRLIPDASASMLVATPNAIRHFKSRHFNSSFFEKNAPAINFAPKIKNIVKAMIEE